MVAIADGLAANGKNSDAGAVIPLLGVLALGAQRLLPALQQAYGGWASLKAYNADLAGVVHMLQLPLPRVLSASAPLELNDVIHLEGEFSL